MLMWALNNIYYIAFKNERFAFAEQKYNVDVDINIITSKMAVIAQTFRNNVLAPCKKEYDNENDMYIRIWWGHVFSHMFF